MAYVDYSMPPNNLLLDGSSVLEGTSVLDSSSVLEGMSVLATLYKNITDARLYVTIRSMYTIPYEGYVLSLVTYDEGTMILKYHASKLSK